MVGYLEKAWKTVASLIDDTHAHTCMHTVVTHIRHTLVLCLHGQCESVRFSSDIDIP